MKRAICLLLAAGLALGLGAGAWAAGPALSGESSAAAGVTITGFRPLESGSGRIRWDVAACAIQPKLVDDGGQVWRVADASPLLDTELFRQEISVTVGPQLVREVALSCGEDGKLNAEISLEGAYGEDQVVVAFSVCWTAKEDTSLTGAGREGEQALAVSQGAKLEAVCKVVLNSAAIQVNAYPEQIPPLVTDRWRGIPALEALHAAEES